MILTKLCAKCKDNKSTEDFRNDKSRKDGKYPWCKLCSSSYYQKNTLKIRKRSREWHRNNKEKKYETQKE